jgi:aspartate racemase
MESVALIASPREYDDMHRLGIIGGIGPESTVAYYRAILRTARTMGMDAPSVLINSIDVWKLLRLVGDNELGKLADYLTAEIAVLADGGASAALLAANTPHIVFDEVRSRARIPMISIVEATRDAASTRGIRRVGLLGTKFTMEGRFYAEACSRVGIDVIAPNALERAYVHDKYVNELLENVFLADTHTGLTEVIESLRDRDEVEAVILAGTELPMILPGETVAGIPLLDTTQIHVKAAAEHLWGPTAAV